MSPEKRAAKRERFSATVAGGFLGSLTLIHTNNCSNPASMRVTARFDFPKGVPLNQCEPLLFLMARRAFNGQKSTG